MRITTTKKSYYRFGAALAILITIGAIGYQSLGHLREDTAGGTHSHLVLQSLEAGLSQMTEAESGERGFAITGDERLLEPHSAASGTIAGSFEALRHLTAGDPGRQGRLRRLGSLITRKIAERQEVIALWKSAGLGAALKAYTTLEGTRRMDEIRHIIQEITVREETLLRKRTQRTETSARATRWTILLGSLLACLVVPFSCLLISHDMAPRRKSASALHESEEKMRRAPDDLETHVQERTAQLATANEDLQSLASALRHNNRQLQEFADASSHDLQEPLRKIMAFGNRLQDKHGGALPADGRDCLARMLSSAQRMQKLIDDLLSFSRVATHAQPFVRVDLTRAAEEALSDLGARVAQTRGRVEIGNLPTIEADATQMRQLLQNLIGNALKFHRPETPPLVRVYARRIPEQKTSREGNPPAPASCQIVIEDNGIGFDEAYLDRIFKPFQRLHTRSEGYEGTGIGLTICRKIAERHNGRITASSTPGRGSTFVVTLLASQATDPNAGETEWNGRESGSPSVSS